MKQKAPLVVRILLGLIFFVFGLNGFLHFLPMPPMAGPSGALMEAFGAAGYMMPLIKGTEVICGALLLANAFVPLALVLLSPIVVNILFFHGFLAPAGLPLALVVVACVSFLAWTNKATYAPLFKRK